MNSNDKEIEETRVGQEDWISTLPDDILIRILSVLPTKDSVRTSALSRRWKSLFAFVPVIDFLEGTPHHTFGAIVSQVTNAIIRNRRLSKLSIVLNDRWDSSDILSWINTAISNYVQELFVAVSQSEIVPIPATVFTCVTLVSLILRFRFVLRIPDSVHLPNLKNLCLSNFILSDVSDDESVRRFFSSCPVLECLLFRPVRIDKVRVFNVSVPSLRRLFVHLYDVFSEYEVSINCPNLEVFNYSGYAKNGYSGDILGSVKASYIFINLHNDRSKEGKLMGLVKKVCKTRFLFLSANSMQALLSPPGSLPTFENLIYLELRSRHSVGWRLLPRLLASSPSLSTLCFPEGMYGIYDNVVPFLPPEQVPVCLSDHLKVVMFDNFRGNENEYDLVEYILMNALVLDKLKIRLWLGEGASESGREPRSDLKRQYEVTKRLLSFKRCTINCQIVIVSSIYEKDDTTIFQ